MIFNSYVFILLLIITLIVYYALVHFHKNKLAHYSLIIASFIFYAYYDIGYVMILMLSTLWSYWIGYMLYGKCNHRKGIMIIGILGNIALLCYFKYTNFIITNMNHIFDSELSLLNILLPLGISFFTFQQIAYIIDAYRNKLDSYTFTEFLLSSVYFPKISQGPITLHQDFIPQLHDPSRQKLSYEDLCIGLYMFTMGLSKKLLLADVFGQFVGYGYEHIARLNSTSAILVMLGYTMQIYFDFSGYSDMARGISKMFRLELPMNFNSPYKALSIQDFWGRWHMSLTKFLTQYIYIPLGGNRKGMRRTMINTLIVFFVSGLWHGANWTFIIWGLMHGIWSVIQKHWKTYFDGLHPAFNWLLTFAFVNVAWIFFRSSTLSEAVHMVKLILSCNFGSVPMEMLETLLLPELSFGLKLIPISALSRIIPYILLLGSIPACLILKNTNEKCAGFQPNLRKTISIAILLFWCIISFSSVTTFIYFNF